MATVIALLDRTEAWLQGPSLGGVRPGVGWRVRRWAVLVIPDLVVDVLAAHRLTRLVTADTLTVGPREAIVRWGYRRRDGHNFQLTGPEPGDWTELAITDGPAAPKVATLVTCRWCTGVWVAAGVMVARRVAPKVWAPVADGLAIASASVLLAAVED